MIAQRLLAIAEEIAKLGFQDIVYDIGTDHAYLPIYLIKSGLCGAVAATDISRPSLERARRNAERQGIAALAGGQSAGAGAISGAGDGDGTPTGIIYWLGDGFSAIGGYQAGKVVVMAGIGGKNLAEIAERGIVRAKTASLLILQPMNSHEALREWLIGNSFSILYERLAREGRRIYNVLICKYAGSPEPPYSPEELYTGRRVACGSPGEYAHFLKFTRKKIMNRYGGLVTAGRPRPGAETERARLESVIKAIDGKLKATDDERQINHAGE